MNLFEQKENRLKDIIQRWEAKNIFNYARAEKRERKIVSTCPIVTKDSVLKVRESNSECHKMTKNVRCLYGDALMLEKPDDQGIVWKKCVGCKKKFIYTALDWRQFIWRKNERGTKLRNIDENRNEMPAIPKKGYGGIYICDKCYYRNFIKDGGMPKTKKGQILDAMRIVKTM